MGVHLCYGVVICWYVVVAKHSWTFHCASQAWDTAKSEAKAAIKNNKSEAPKLKEVAKPDYDFYRLLEEQKVVVPKVEAYKSTPKEQVDYLYRLQVASFRSKDDAERLRASLILEGMQAYIQSSEVKGSTWHRIFVGPFDNRSNMNKVHDKLVSRGISPLEFKEPIKKDWVVP